MSNVTPLPNKYDDLAAAAAQIRKSLPHITEYVQMKAKIQRASYEALLEQGFTEAQAVELAKGAI